MQIHIIDSIERLLYYEAEWESILKQTNNDVLFLTLDWIVLWWKFFGDKYKLFVLIMTNNQEIAGICPLMKTNKRLYNEISFIGGRQSSRMDFILRDEFREETIELICDFLRGLKGNNIINLHGMVANSRNYILFIKYLKANKVPSVFCSTICYFLNLKDNDFNTHFKNRFGKETRYKMNKKERKLKELGNLVYKKIPISEIEEVFDIHEKRWLRKMGNSSFSKGRTKEFYKELTLGKNLQIAATVDAVTINNRIISFIYEIQYNGKAYLIRIAHDDDFYFLSPGEVVWKKKIEESFSSRINALDFGPGYEPYKARWTDSFDKVFITMLPSNNLLSYLIFYIKYWIGTKLITALKKNKTIENFRKYRLGKVKFSLSKDNISSKITRIKRPIEQNGLLAYIIKHFNSLISKIFSHKQYLILEKHLDNIEPSKNEMHVKEASIDDLDVLSELMNISPSNIIRRFINKHKCFITIYDEEIMHYCWITNSNISISGIELNIPFGSTDAYIYDSYIKKNCLNEYSCTCILSSLFNLLYKNNFRRCYAAVNSCDKSLENKIYKKIFNPRYKVFVKTLLKAIKYSIIDLEL